MDWYCKRLARDDRMFEGRPDDDDDGDGDGDEDGDQHQHHYHDHHHQQQQQHQHSPHCKFWMFWGKKSSEFMTLQSLRSPRLEHL